MEKLNEKIEILKKDVNTMYKLDFVRDEKVFENCGRYLGKRLMNQRLLLEYQIMYEIVYGSKLKLKILITLYEDFGFGKVKIKKRK